jgi:hypothetical protein
MIRRLVFLCLAFCLAFLIVMPASAAANVWTPWGKDTGDKQTNEIVPAMPDIGQKIANTLGAMEIKKTEAELKTEGWRKVTHYHIPLSYAGDYTISPKYHVPPNTRRMLFELYSPSTGDFDLGILYGGIWYWSTTGGTGGYDSILLRMRPGHHVQMQVWDYSGYGTSLLKVWKHA